MSILAERVKKECGIMAKRNHAGNNVLDVLKERGLLSRITRATCPRRRPSLSLSIAASIPRPPVCTSAISSGDGAGALSALRPPPHPGSRWWHRHGRGPKRQIGGAPSAHRKAGRRVCRAHTGAAAGYLSFEGQNAAIMVDNSTWLGNITLLEYLRRSSASTSP